MKTWPEDEHSPYDWEGAEHIDSDDDDDETCLLRQLRSADVTVEDVTDVIGPIEVTEIEVCDGGVTIYVQPELEIAGTVTEQEQQQASSHCSVYRRGECPLGMSAGQAAGIRDRDAQALAMVAESVRQHLGSRMDDEIRIGCIIEMHRIDSDDLPEDLRSLYDELRAYFGME